MKGRHCPLCERPWPNDGSFSPLWKKIIQYVDGTRTSREIAELIGSTANSVRVAISHMRRCGVEVNTCGRTPKRLEAERPHRKRAGRRDRARDYVRIRELRVDAQLPWKHIGKTLGMSGQYVARYFADLCKTYGN